MVVYSIVWRRSPILFVYGTSLDFFDFKFQWYLLINKVFNFVCDGIDLLQLNVRHTPVRVGTIAEEFRSSSIHAHLEEAREIKERFVQDEVYQSS